MITIIDLNLRKKAIQKKAVVRQPFKIIYSMIELEFIVQ